MDTVIAVRDFQRDVIDRSFSVPVLVDFWAEWCAPCRILGPVLERLAGEAGGRWTLATLDTEEHPRVAADWGIRSIPNVKLFMNGAAVNEFTGALPEHAVRQWLEAAIPSDAARTIARARELIAAGAGAAAAGLLRELAAAEPENAEARVLLARATLLQDPAAAAQAIRGVEAPALSDEIDTITTVAHLHEVAGGRADLPPDPARDAYLRGAQAFAVGDYDAALETFIGVIRENRRYDDDGSRKACLAIFRLLGEEHEITLRHRREFGSALYV